ncbi:adhesin [Algoriphagus namhaensis]
MIDNSSSDLIIKDRKQLKQLFAEGKLPKEKHFVYLIDSMFNKLDDGIHKSEKDGWMIFPAGDEEKLLSFYDGLKEEKASWMIVNSKGESKGLILRAGDSSYPTIFFQKAGNIGIGTLDPKHKLQVQGIIASEGRVGVFHQGTAPADGKWHEILGNLDGCQGFEIMAYAGKKDYGKYALTHAIALSTFGRSKSKIRTTSAHYGAWWHKLSFRWRGDTRNYSLQIKTWSNYGDGERIHFQVSKLWDDRFLKDF